MKYLFIILFTLIFVSCKEKNNSAEIKLPKHSRTDSLNIGINYATGYTGGKSENYDSECIVGKKYFICSAMYDKGDPFKPIHTVIIIKKIKGYVQYCEFYDYKKTNKTTFSRSCKDFIYLVNLCK